MRAGQAKRWLGGGLLAVACLVGIGCLGHHHAGPPIALPPPGAVPTEMSKVTLPPYVVEAPDILLIEVYLPPRDDMPANPMDKNKEPMPPGLTTKGPVALPVQPITGQHFVRPDGTVNLGVWGNVLVSGLTLEDIAQRIRMQVAHQATRYGFMPEDWMRNLIVVVDVLSYNSKSYYVITDGATNGEQIYRFPISGSETVLDALAQINGIPPVGSKRNVWIARRTPHMGQHEQILPVDYVGLTQHGVTATNYQVLPGDRIYVQSQRIIRADNMLAKFLAPIERLMGSVLLGSTTVNSIEGRGLSGGVR